MFVNNSTGKGIVARYSHLLLPSSFSDSTSLGTQYTSAFKSTVTCGESRLEENIRLLVCERGV